MMTRSLSFVATVSSSLLLYPHADVYVLGFQHPLPSRRISYAFKPFASIADESSMGSTATTQDEQQPISIGSTRSAASTANSAKSPDMQAYSNGFKTAFTEISYALSSPTVGSLPSDLVGTYYKCGPAMFSAGSLPPPKNSLVKPKQPPVPDGKDSSRMVLHPFEGDGAVLAITFHGDKVMMGQNDENINSNNSGQNDSDENIPRVDTMGKVTTRFRYVRTNAFTNERKKGKKLYTGMESTRSVPPSSLVGNDIASPPFYRHHLLSGLNKMRKNTSNTRAVYFGKRLLTLWSGGLPYKLDALALSTDGRSQLGGVIKKEDSSLGAKAAIDAKKNRILFFGVDEESGSSQLNIYEFNSKFQPIKDNEGVVQVKLPGLAMIYDFAVTENYAVFVQPILKVNGMQYMLSKEPGKSVSLESESSVRV
jgi:all-trans-8'-apo-beta-carotenal 15,15'-oxygenase